MILYRMSKVHIVRRMPTRIDERLGRVLNVSLEITSHSRNGFINQGMLAELSNLATIAVTDNRLLAFPSIYRPVACKGQKSIKG